MESHHDLAHEKLKTASEHSAQEMRERHRLEMEELEKQHEIEWQLKEAKEKIAKLELEK